MKKTRKKDSLYISLFLIFLSGALFAAIYFGRDYGQRVFSVSEALEKTGLLLVGIIIFSAVIRATVNRFFDWLGKKN